MHERRRRVGMDSLPQERGKTEVVTPAWSKHEKHPHVLSCNESSRS
jgi:hypothetical protein